jgi:UDP-N-acetylmuramyl pentapeptide synthase
VRGVPKGGLAILNADDPSVAAMREVASCGTVLAGTDPNADLRAEEVCSIWPDPLSMVVSGRTDRFRVRTQLHGEQWVFPVLAAVELGRRFGVPTAEVCSAIADCPPAPGRMSALCTPAGVHWLCDDWKAPVWSFAEVLKQLRQARADRRVLVLGSFSDSPLKPRRLYARLARQGRAVAQQVCLVGRHAHHGLRARKDTTDGSIQAFQNAPAAADFLAGFLRRGDLVVVKATATERGRLSSEIFKSGSIR